MQPLSDNVDAQRLPHAITEFFVALKNPFTYSPRQNHEVVFGFLWGLPVPFFALFIHAYATGTSFGVGSLWQIASAHPVYIAFFLHPLLFATIFGALGTMRAHRERQIHAMRAILSGSLKVSISSISLTIKVLYKLQQVTVCGTAMALYNIDARYNRRRKS